MLPGAHTHAQCCVLAHALSHPATSPSPVACSIEAQLVAAQMASAIALLSGHTSPLLLHGDDAARALPDTILLVPCCPLPPLPTAACCTPTLEWASHGLGCHRFTGGGAAAGEARSQMAGVGS